MASRPPPLLSSLSRKSSSWLIPGVFLLCGLQVPYSGRASAKPSASAGGANVHFPSFRYNQRNYWLEYSTPPTTVFPEYNEDDDYEEVNEIEGSRRKKTTTTPEPGPYFVHGGEANNTMKTVPIGGTVSFDCKIGMLMDHQVSWFRRDGSALHLLTIGRETFTPDARYSLAYHPPDNWRLRIRPAQQRDNGTYLCQVSTHPPIILLSHLNVIVPEVFLVDEDGHEISEKHYKPGSTIEMHCIVHNYLPEFDEVLWRHDGKVITQDSDRGGISIKSKRLNATVSSHLYLATAAAADSGVYTCSLENLARAALSLHILNGEEPAAIQSSAAAIPRSRAALALFSGAWLLLLLTKCQEKLRLTSGIV